jgi:hypothetical protein
MNDEDDAAWTDCVEALHDLAHRLSDRLATGSLTGRATDLAEKFFANVMAAYLTHLRADPGNPAFLPSVGYYQMYGSPNPDTVYRTASIDGRGTYALSGYRGTVPDLTLMPFGAPTANGLETFGELDFDDLEIDESGWFDVVLSQERPVGVESWWRLDPRTRSLMLRSVSDAWGSEVDPRVAIVRTDVAPGGASAEPGVRSEGLRSYAHVVEAMMMSGIRHVEQLRQDGVNRLVLVDYGQGGGRHDQWYHEGCFQLSVDEALLIRTVLPTGCRAFSLSLTDSFFSTIDWANQHSSLNQRQTAVGPDGELNVLVSAVDTGFPNWLSTAGHRDGVLQLRWTGGTRPPEPTVTKMQTADCTQLCDPAVAVSPERRIEAIRRRQIGSQLRSLW